MRLTTIFSTLAAAVALTAVIPNVASAQSRTTPPLTAQCDTLAGTRTLYTGAFNLPAPYGKPQTFPLAQHGPISACVYGSHTQYHNFDLTLERQPVTQPMDTPWETIKTTVGAQWWVTATTPYFTTLKSLETDLTITSGFRYRWRVTQTAGIGSFKLLIVQR
jgi:hypothetical protein